MKSWCKKLLTAGLIFMTAVAAVKTPMPVYADEVSGNSVQYITDDDRWRASVELKNYKESLIKRENPEQYIIDDLDDIMYSGQYYIANSEYMTPDAMWSYVEKVKAEMDTAIGKSGSVTTTTEFLTVADNWTTPSVSYGQSVEIVLPLINLGEEWLTDLLVEPRFPTTSRNGHLSPTAQDIRRTLTRFRAVPQSCMTKRCSTEES